MKDTYTYCIGDQLYINLTNRCTNRCTFCVRDQSAQYEGYSLWLQGGEPNAAQVIAEIGDPKRYAEVVFCGYGEPTFRLDVMLEICAYVHAGGGRTRLNTNGHGNVIQGKNIAPLLKGALDMVNISLNESTEERYDALCRPHFRHAFGEVLAFARALREEGVACRFSLVDCIGAGAVARCRAIAEEIGIPLYVREMIHNG